MKTLFLSLLVIAAGSFFQQKTAPLTADEEKSILFMREEEKLARDVYLKLYDQWQLMPFKNIAQSEQMHMDALLTLITRYNLKDPVGDKDNGVFENEDLQKLYNDLTSRGLQNQVEALKVGALIEEIDIRDLQQHLDRYIQNEDVKLVYNNLMRGSRNHLRAFSRNLEMRNATYTPSVLEQDQYNGITQSKQECNNTNCDGACNGNCQSKGNKKGKGKKARM